MSFFDEMKAASSAAMALTGNVYGQDASVKTQGLPLRMEMVASMNVSQSCVERYFR